jgi:glycosyltransferase involved in cell wall biosynthesis
MRGIGLVRAIVVGIVLLMMLTSRRATFDREFYRARYSFSRLVRWAPLLEFCFRGSRALRDPSPSFSQQGHVAAFPFTVTYPPILHALLHRIAQPAPEFSTETAPQQPQPDVQSVFDLQPPATKQQRLQQLWPLLSKDMVGLRDVANSLTPTVHLQYTLMNVCLEAPVVHTGTVMQQVMDRLPERVDHLLILPWLGISGGSEKVSQRLLKALRAHYRDGRLCILAPDSIFDLGLSEQHAYGVPIAAVNDVDRTLSLADRTEIVDRVLIQLRPKTVHTINSDAGWYAFRECAKYYKRDCRLFGNIYSDIRFKDGTPAGVFWRFLPEVLPHLTGVIADNEAVVRRAEQYFSLLQEQMERFSVLPTPIVGIDGQDPISQCRRWAQTGGQNSLWMSRIAREKRLDVLQLIAARLPDRNFSIYGALIAGAVPEDYLAWTAKTGNVRHVGEFSDLASLPVGKFDSYVFTTSAEGMPLSLLEATMLGLPIVAPDIGGIGEFIDETTGWLVPGADSVDAYVAALNEIRDFPTEAARRVEAAQQRLIARHSWSNFCRCLAAIPGYLSEQLP